MFRHRRGGSRMTFDATQVVSLLVAIIGGLALLFNGRNVAVWAARLARRQDKEKRTEELTAAKLTAEQSDRDRISREFQWTISDLRSEIATLTQRHDDLREQLDKLNNDFDILKRANTVLHVTNINLHAENDRLKEQLTQETTKREALERRVDNQDAAIIVLRRELHQHGIPIPALAKADGGSP